MGLFEQPFEPPGVAPSGLPVDQESEALLEGQGVAGRLGELFLERARHAVEFETAQSSEGVLGKHRGPFRRVSQW